MSKKLNITGFSTGGSILEIKGIDEVVFVNDDTSLRASSGTVGGRQLFIFPRAYQSLLVEPAQ